MARECAFILPGEKNAAAGIDHFIAQLGQLTRKHGAQAHGRQ
ncbi:MAG TPA: hypothetical protein VGS02_12420 [Acidobacteriaceae bacterium]|nr:hypothetical protein [Acidobacteriaceae bacterium]